MGAGRARATDTAGASDRPSVADGKTNREVAATLFLSPKTIEFHLTHIYRKLDIHSRSELVRRIADDETMRVATASGEVIDKGF